MDITIIIYELFDLLIFENISLILDSSVTSGLLFSLLIEFLIFNNHNKKFSFDLSASYTTKKYFARGLYPQVKFDTIALL